MTDEPDKPNLLRQFDMPARLCLAGGFVAVVVLAGEIAQKLLKRMKGCKIL